MQNSICETACCCDETIIIFIIIPKKDERNLLLNSLSILLIRYDAILAIIADPWSEISTCTPNSIFK